MGTIERIRKISPYAFVVFAVLFIVFMVLSDNVTTLSRNGENPQTAAICDINGEKIYYKDFEARVKQRLEQMQMQQSQLESNQRQDIDEQMVRNQIWDEMVEEILTKQAGEQFGITVSDDEIADILIESPPDFLKRSFIDSNGVFDRNLYLKIITNPEELVNHLGQDPSTIDPAEREELVNNFRTTLIATDNHLRLQKLNTALASTVSASYAVTSPSYVEERYVSDSSEANVNYIFVGVNSIADSIKVSDDEIKAYYDKHQNSFKTKNARQVKSLYFMLQPSADDSAKMNNRITTISNDLMVATSIEAQDSIFSVKLNEYSGTEHDWALIQDINPLISGIIGNAQKGAVIGPIQFQDGTYFLRLDGKREGEQEVVRASHILIGVNDNKDSAKAEAMRIFKEAQKGDFAALAAQYSIDKGSAAQGGDLGYFGKGRMVPEFDKVAFEAKVGSIVGPIETRYGYHIIKIADKKSEEIKYSSIVFNPTTSITTKKNVKRAAFAAMQQIKAGANIDTLATKLNVRCEVSPLIEKNRPYLNSMYLTNSIFEAKVGDVLEPKELNNVVVVVVQLSQIRQSGVATIEDVREQVMQKIIKTKKLDIAKVKAQNIYNNIASTSSLVAFMADTNLAVKNAQIRNNGSISGAAQDVAATTHMFKLPINKINEPVRGELGYYIIEVKDRTIADKSKAQESIESKMQYTRTLFDSWFAKFKEDADIQDMRSKFYQEY